MFYIRAISIMFKNSFSLFFGLFVGFGLVFLAPLIYILPEFYIDSVRYIGTNIGNLFFGSNNSGNDIFYMSLIMFIFLCPKIIIISLIISKINIKLHLIYKKFILSVIIMPFLCYIMALFFKMNGNKTTYTYTSIDGSIAMINSSRPVPLWEKYLDLDFFEMHIASVFLFVVFFMIFTKIMKDSKRSKEINF